MTAHLRFATFVAIVLVATAVAPTRAADAVLPPAKPRVALGGDDMWRLRETDASGEGRNGAGAIAGAPRAVRLVYPPLIAPR